MSKGKRICELRKKKGLTAAQLGALIGRDRATIYRYENGSFEKIDAEIMRALARSLGTSVEYLLGETDDPDPDIWERPMYDTPLVLTPDEEDLIRKLRSLPEEGRQDVMEIVRIAFSAYVRYLTEGTDDAGI